MSKTEPKVKSISLLDRQAQLEKEIKRLKALLPVRRKGESDENYAFRVDQANANFKRKGNLNIKGDPNRIISKYQEGGHTAKTKGEHTIYSNQLRIGSTPLPWAVHTPEKFNTIGNTITNLESALSASRAQIGKRYLNRKEALRLGIKWNPTLANNSTMVNPNYNEYYDLKYAKPIVIDLPKGGTFTADPSHPLYWELKDGQTFTQQELNPSLKSDKPLSNTNLTINQTGSEPGTGAELNPELGARPEHVNPFKEVSTQKLIPGQNYAMANIKKKEKAPADLTWVDIDNRAKGHTLVGADYRGSVGGKNSVANNKARLLLNRARDINLAYGYTLDDAGKRKYLDSNKSEALKIAEA